ncbi:DUF421 domain-containing protein [Paenibacillus sp. P25]|nr:DUF421 domain-containing protein [Paenibacillus sp. P25]
MGIVNLSDVKTATLESNGQIGYELHEDAQPVKMKQWKELLQVLSDKPDTRLPASAVPVSRTDLVGKKGRMSPIRLPRCNKARFSLLKVIPPLALSGTLIRRNCSRSSLSHS